MHVIGVDEQAPRTTIHVLGGFALTTLDQLVPLPQGAQRLVAFLALSPRPATRASVAGRLWPDLPDDRAGATLRTTLWQMRRRAPGVVSGDPVSIRLSAAAEVDLWRARACARDLTHPKVRDAVAVDGEHLPGAAVPAWLTDLFQLDLLPDWPDDWVEIERERYRQIRLHALECMCRAMSGCGRTMAAIDLALGAVAADPLRETAQRVLIEAHLADGNPSEAVRQYRSYAVELRAALGVDPTPQLAALVPVATLQRP
jgi:DNA-binding SARP family transcriptional activator